MLQVVLFLFLKAKILLLNEQKNSFWKNGILFECFGKTIDKNKKTSNTYYVKSIKTYLIGSQNKLF